MPKIVMKIGFLKESAQTEFKVWTYSRGEKSSCIQYGWIIEVNKGIFEFKKNFLI